jgi:hypothetical protein
VAVVEECAHSVHDALFLPSEKSRIFSILYFRVSMLNRGERVKGGGGKTNIFLHNDKRFHMALTFLLKLKLASFIIHASKRVCHDYISNSKDSTLSSLVP